MTDCMNVHSLQLSRAATEGMDVIPRMVYRPKEIKPSNMDDSLNLKSSRLPQVTGKFSATLGYTSML